MAHERHTETTNHGLVQSTAKWKILLAGASAGLVVDGTLFPLDTIKSRLQSKLGLYQSGGFSNLYRGIQPVLAGSVPSAAIFFITYESIKGELVARTPSDEIPAFQTATHVIAAAAGETMSCLVRVPYELVKTRSQTNVSQKFSSLNVARDVLAKEGPRGLYRGFASTVARDVPFSALQYPIWEALKSNHFQRHQQTATVPESAIYGCIAGAVSALATTPLDVVKTRIMLADKKENLAGGNVIEAMRDVWSERGVRGLFAGLLPRVIWISSGAAIFLGAYEQVALLLKWSDE